MTTLPTQRLLLRGFKPKDAADVFAYAKSSNVGPSAGWSEHQTLEESERVVRMFMQSEDVWAIELRETGHVIGSIGLHQDLRRNFAQARNLGYVLSEAYWGQGLMPEAAHAVIRYGFIDMHLLIISASYYPFNQQSRRVMEKCGMRYEGTMRMASRLYNGEYRDEVLFSITREEFLSAH